MSIKNLFGPKVNGSQDIKWHSSAQKVQKELQVLQEHSFQAPQTPLVNYAFKEFSKAPQFTDQVKLQVIEAAYAEIDAEGNFQLRNFSLQGLSISELVLLYTIIDRYQKEPTAVGRKVLLAHLFLIEKKVRVLAESFRDKIETSVNEINDESARKLRYKALSLPNIQNNSMAGSGFQRLDETLSLRIFEYLTPEEQAVAKRVCKYWNIMLNGTYFAGKCMKRFQNNETVRSGFFSSSMITRIFASEIPALPVKVKMEIVYGLYTKSLQMLSIPRKEEHPQVLPIKDMKDQDERYRASVFVQFVLSLPDGVIPLQSIQFLKEAPDLTTLINRAAEVRRMLATLPSVRTLAVLSLSKSNIRQNVTVLPQAIKFFTSLRVLEIEGNDLPALPRELSSLANLQMLKLRKNHIPTLPQGFGNLVNLKVLDLSDNQMHVLPDDFTNLEKLENLNLGQNKLSALPKGFEKLGCLKVLDLNHNEFPEIPRCLALFENLMRLDLHHNPFQISKKELEASFPNFSKVPVQHIHYEQVSDNSTTSCL